MKLPYWLINAIGFQLGWFVCVLLGTAFALVYTLVALFLHFRWGPARPEDWLAVALALPMGVLHDNLLGYFGVLDYSAASGSQLAPYWLLCLWVLMALTFHHALHWFYQRPWVLAVMSALGGPMAYFGGVMLSPVEWGVLPWQGLVVLVIIWVWLLPLHRWLVHKAARLCAL